LLGSYAAEPAFYGFLCGTTYTLLSGALSYSVKRVMRRQKLYQQRFSISRLNPIACKEGKVDLCDNHDSHMRFLIRFCRGADGAKLSGQLRRIVELIYKRIDWDLDPPEEYAKYFLEDGQGFVLVQRELDKSSLRLRDNLAFSKEVFFRHKKALNCLWPL